MYLIIEHHHRQSLPSVMVLVRLGHLSWSNSGVLSHCSNCESTHSVFLDEDENASIFQKQREYDWNQILYSSLHDWRLVCAVSNEQELKQKILLRFLNRFEQRCQEIVISFH